MSTATKHTATLTNNMQRNNHLSRNQVRTKTFQANNTIVVINDML